MIALPKHVDVLGKRYRIIRKLPPGHSHEKVSLYGLFDHELNFIYINPKLNYEHTWRTYFHEHRHAVQYRNGLTFTELTPNVLEMDAETSGSAMYEFLVHTGVLGE